MTENSKMAWFPCYVNDLLGSMRWKCMTAEERGAYWQLICWQMQSDDGHLPADIKTLSVLADVDLCDKQSVVDAFPVNGNGKRANVRALKEWKKRMEIGASRSQAASTAANSRWHQQRMRDASVTHSKGNASECTATSTSTSTDTARETTKKKKADKPPPARNPLIDSIASIEAENLDEVTNWGKHAKALSIIRRVSPDVTPEEISRRASNWHTHFDGATVSSTAVANNWARLDKKGTAHKKKEYGAW